MKGGVLIIGSLLWDKDTNNRDEWWHRLDLKRKQKVLLPIRYGRTSTKNRKGTYSMVFSTSLEKSNKLGVGYFVPFAKEINSREDFREEVLDFAMAEGFHQNRIAANWGAVCLKINQEISQSNSEFLLNAWSQLVNDNINNRNIKQTIPNLKEFGESTENKSITDNWILNINDNIFAEIPDVDFILATSNALKHRKTNEIKYPSKLEIAKAMIEGDYYEYFLRNRLSGIKTNEDKIILKILKKRFKVKLKDKRKNWG
ncbi:hypothetical protein OU798_02650 [Prolixibacteraceae bacterium Z1-6]|uniref:Uncharacterized protein n=1 Tax=Draconibacterium aestuarii TaxID=2998507 RepID=A0A9X3J628_9BACT|nr:hypothetical protein [Prolixibacteraceae bacterium Z1-6]